MQVFGELELTLPYLPYPLKRKNPTPSPEVFDDLKATYLGNGADYFVPNFSATIPGVNFASPDPSVKQYYVNVYVECVFNTIITNTDGYTFSISILWVGGGQAENIPSTISIRSPQALPDPSKNIAYTTTLFVERAVLVQPGPDYTVAFRWLFGPDLSTQNTNLTSFRASLQVGGVLGSNQVIPSIPFAPPLVPLRPPLLPLNPVLLPLYPPLLSLDFIKSAAKKKTVLIVILVIVIVVVFIVLLWFFLKRKNNNS